ncbi:hypothetical protein [Deinococcus sp.]|uniref:type IV pilin protein n=1 Tax=Deinococcus sp. TaxID=47478 RepID=UPI0025F6D12A|nr:hypothetical protein [Deinococcus sp.]
MTGPAFPPQFPPPPPLAQKPPGYAAGLLLNIFLPGSGFTYLGRWNWHLIWMLGLAALSVAVVIAAAASGATLLLALPTVVYLGMLVHYHVMYGQIQAAWAAGAPPALSDGVKLGLILGHVALGFVALALTGVLAAILIPNLIGARQRAYDTGAQSCAKSIQTALAVAQIDNQEYPKTIDKTIGGASSTCAPAQITVSGSGNENDYSFTVRDSRGNKTYSATPASLTPQPQ